jgi:thioester reductase-like protein
MSKDKGRVLVTGGAGFIGSHVCAAFRDAGWSVVALDDLSTGKIENVPDGVKLIEDDIRSASTADLIHGGDFEVVSHQAAQVDVRLSVARPDHDAALNVMGLLNLLEASRAAEVRRFVFASSGGVVYGEPETVPFRCAMPTCTVRGRIRTGRRASWRSSVGACWRDRGSPYSGTGNRHATTCMWGTWRERIWRRPTFRFEIRSP